MSIDGKQDLEIGEVILERDQDVTMEVEASDYANPLCFKNPQLTINGEHTNWCLRMDRILPVSEANDLADKTTEAIISENKEKQKFVVQAEVSHKIQCIPVITNYKVDQKNKNEMFDIDKKEINQIETEKSDRKNDVYDMFKK